MSIGTAGATMRKTSNFPLSTSDHGEDLFPITNGRRHPPDDSIRNSVEYNAIENSFLNNNLSLGESTLNCRLGSSQRRSDVLAQLTEQSLREKHTTSYPRVQEARSARTIGFEFTASSQVLDTDTLFSTTRERYDGLKRQTVANTTTTIDNNIIYCDPQTQERSQSDHCENGAALEATNRVIHQRDISIISSVNRVSSERDRRGVITQLDRSQRNHNSQSNARISIHSSKEAFEVKNRYSLTEKKENTTISSSVKTNASQLSTLSGRTMGFNNTTASSSAWNAPGTTVEKLEASTLQTEQSREDEDDNSTIRSLDSLLHDAMYSPQLPPHVTGTPSTISTAASADDASFQHHPQQHHRRVDSWEGLPPYSLDEGFAPNYATQAAHSQGAWSAPRSQQHVASFRTDGVPPIAPRWQQQHHPLPFVPREANSSSNRTGLYMAGAGATYENRRGPPPLHPSSATTPPRTPRPSNPQPPSAPPATPNNVNNSPHRYATGSRSSSEVLKTLLRKKACLYEPDTSRAVTLITWLVGRILALEFGYFSRQQLQAGVHACVSHKIDSGIITRTKVNRCMQIILNSCFHYIIPRPDGTEENGDTFREAFAAQVSNDDHMLRHLPSPWNDMSVRRDDVLLASTSALDSPTHTPQASPQLTSVNAPVSPTQRDSDDKRAVLLCFNENVRSALDVFRCHNEFIHDTAHASHLQLSSHEWRQFFGADNPDSAYIWGDVGVPLTHPDGQAQRIDSLGVLSNQEAAAFRTTWCSKRYDHQHELCGFAHAEVNGGWLRRNPAVFEYSEEMCPFVHKLQKDSKVLVLHECPNGIRCPKAHSLEEVAYHPNQYKTRICQQRQCSFGDVCPNFHPVESHRTKKSDVRGRHARTPPTSSKPAGAPILYTCDAPMSAFDMDIKTPGLQNLYRRHCAVTRALLRQQNAAFYHLFDTNDVSPDKSHATQQSRDQWNHFKAD